MPVSIEHPPEHPHVALVRLDRPARANALDPAMLNELAEAWRRLAADDDVRCVVLTGAGDRVFCAGMDIDATLGASQALARGERIDDADFAGLRAVQTATLVDFDLGKPLVCAVNGHARGAGFDLMLVAELRFAVPEATFALEEVALGLYPTGHATVLLPRQIPWVHAQELLLGARPVDADHALRIGLVNRLVPRGELLETALAAAGRIASNAPLAVAATRAGVRELCTMPLLDAWQRQEELGRPLRRSEDAREARRAFLERRRPVFHGR